MARITVSLDDREVQAVVQLAQLEKRLPRQQAAFLIREGLIARGLLNSKLQSKGAIFSCQKGDE